MTTWVLTHTNQNYKYPHKTKPPSPFSISPAMPKTASTLTVFPTMQPKGKWVVINWINADIFRPYPGFQQIRLIRKSTSTGREYLLCFVDFENNLQSTIAMNTLQGYRFDKHDKIGLKISYANESRDDKYYKWMSSCVFIEFIPFLWFPLNWLNFIWILNPIISRSG